MHGHLEISGPNHPKGGVQYRNQGPKLNVQCCPTLDEPENIKLINKNAKIYSAPGLKRKTFYKTVTRTPKHKKLQSRLLTPSAPISMLEIFLGEQTMLLQMWFFIYPAEKTSCGKTFHH